MSLLPSTGWPIPINTCSGRRHRLRTLPGRLGYGLLRGSEEGMTAAELRALPIVIYERRHRHHPRGPTFNELLVLSFALVPKDVLRWLMICT